MRSSLTVVETVYHSVVDGQPTAIEHRSNVSLTSEEQVFLRSLKVGFEWVELPTGWLDGASHVTVENGEGTFSVNPTDAEREAAWNLVLQVGVCVGMLIVPFADLRPGASCRLPPTDVKSLRLRCEADQCRVRVAVFPE